MSSITFEVATLADAIKKADAIAPTRGSAFDKAAGILIEFDPAGVPMAVMRATNLDIYRMEWLDTIEMEGETTRWRLPKLFATIVSGLPIGSGKMVTFTEQGGQVHMKAGRTKAKFNLLDSSYYPFWDPFDPDKMYSAKDLGGKMAMVEWAVSKDLVPLTGVHLNGEYAIGTDRFRLAAVPLSIPELTAPVTVPGGLLSQLLKQTGEIQIGVVGGMLHVMPDEYTQIKCVTYAEDFPNMSGFFNKEFSDKIELDRKPLLEIMQRADVFAGSADRVGAPLKMYLGKEKIAVVMDNVEVGQIGDVIDVPGFCDHDPRIEVLFTSRYIIDAFAKAPNDKVTFLYDRTTPRVVGIDGGSGYRAWVAVRSPQTSDSGT